MLTNLVLTHPCGTAVQLDAGAWTTLRGAFLTHCEGCGEWLGSAFTQAEGGTETTPLPDQPAGDDMTESAFEPAGPEDRAGDHGCCGCTCHVCRDGHGEGDGLHTRDCVDRFNRELWVWPGP